MIGGRALGYKVWPSCLPARVLPMNALLPPLAGADWLAPRGQNANMGRRAHATRDFGQRSSGRAAKSAARMDVPADRFSAKFSAVPRNRAMRPTLLRERSHKASRNASPSLRHHVKQNS